MEAFRSWGTGWIKLDKIIAQFVDAINYRTPQKGSGILLTETPTGVIISLDPKSNTRAQQPAPLGGGGGGTTGGPTEGQWVTITLVDPVSCTQSTIQVWSKQGTP
jgi:hypothetical protein